MGGWGSGRRSTKESVEESFGLAVRDLWRIEPVSQVGSVRPGPVLRAYLAGPGGNYLRVDYQFESDSPNRLTVMLEYSVLKEKLEQEVQLQPTYPNYGGRRWWFVCYQCRRRSGRLIVLPWAGGAGRFFRCRRCCGLTYQSSKDSHKDDALYAEIGLTPREARRQMKNNPRRQAQIKEQLRCAQMRKVIADTKVWLAGVGDGEPDG